jgi:hypothetical protein
MKADAEILPKGVISSVSVIGRRRRILRGWRLMVGRRYVWLIRRLVIQNVCDGCPKFLEGEGFEQQCVHIAARLSKHFVFLGKCRGHDDGLIGQQLPDAGDQLIAVHSRHGKIRYYHVEAALGQLFQSCFAALGLPDCVPRMLQQYLDGMTHQWLVIYHQYFNSLFHKYRCHIKCI